MECSPAKRWSDIERVDLGWRSPMSSATRRSASWSAAVGRYLWSVSDQAHHWTHRQIKIWLWVGRKRKSVNEVDGAAKQSRLTEKNCYPSYEAERKYTRGMIVVVVVVYKRNTICSLKIVDKTQNSKDDE